jgi:hypothetical protein
MNSPTITMEKDAAVKKLDAYEQAARRNPAAFQELDRGILQGYRVLARGGRLVDVNEAIKVGGLNLAGIPKLTTPAQPRKENASQLAGANASFEFAPRRSERSARGFEKDARIWVRCLK